MEIGTRVGAIRSANALGIKDMIGNRIIDIVKS